ncbi:MAG: UbiD family decarboxylase [Bacteroidia bacterium]|nr:UbiD family decarboxylase [Bacteroidia bacterium]
MGYSSLRSAIEDLRKAGQLLHIPEEVDPELEMAAIHRQINNIAGPAIYFEKVKGSPFPAVSNLFGTMDRARFLFRDELPLVKKVMKMKQDPSAILNRPWKHLGEIMAARKAFPQKTNTLTSLSGRCRLSDLPALRSWPLDGGKFITLPLVYTEDPELPGVKHSNLGMYRVQISGNEYLPEQEMGLHYQIHRGIGIHHTKAAAKNEPLRVTVFTGGSPAHTLAAIMPLPEGISELMFAGLLAGRKFHYGYHGGYFIPADADFVITGTIDHGTVKPEGPFGDHLGYYSLAHPFPVMKVDGVFHRKDPIWPFTVVGRPRQEDSVFGELIHELTGDLIPSEIPGVKEVHAVDEAGVHPLLLATGKERYTPYSEDQRPAELLTTANRILGTGQLSLAKFLFIATDSRQTPSVHDTKEFFRHMLERIDTQTDLHFHTETTADTLDYSGTGLNRGSKLVIAAGKMKRRTAEEKIPDGLNLTGCHSPTLILPGILTMSAPVWIAREEADKQLHRWATELGNYPGETFKGETRIPLVIFTDENTISATDAFRDWLWVTFTRCNPSHDVEGVNSFISYKHWGCKGSLLFDARIKKHHAPVLRPDEAAESRAEALIRKYSRTSR